jgi:hypothetical protein
VVRPWVRAVSFLIEIDILPPAARPEVNRTVVSSLRNLSSPDALNRPIRGQLQRSASQRIVLDRRSSQPGRPKRPHAPDRLRLARVAGRDPYRHNGGRDRKDIGAEPAMPNSYNSGFHAIRHSPLTLRAIIVKPIAQPVTKSRLRQF